jgi:hypothetical protein
VDDGFIVAVVNDADDVGKVENHFPAVCPSCM